jgi:hypothetical protein
MTYRFHDWKPTGAGEKLEPIPEFLRRDPVETYRHFMARADNRPAPARWHAEPAPGTAPKFTRYLDGHWEVTR